MAAINHPIVNGPSIHAMVDAFRYAYDRNNPHRVQISADMGFGLLTVYEVQISSLGHEDSSGVSLLFGGNFKVVSSGSASMQFRVKHDRPQDPGEVRNGRLHGWYNANSKKGWIILD